LRIGSWGARMHTYLMLVLFIAARVFGLVYAFIAVLDAQSEVVEPPAENELRFVAVNWAFDQEEYRVKQGETMILSLHNQQGRHGIEIEGLGIELYEGEPVEYTFEEPGTYRVICNILCGPGHEDMVATLIVE